MWLVKAARNLSLPENAVPITPGGSQPSLTHTAWSVSLLPSLDSRGISGARKFLSRPPSTGRC